mgnify:CR=1 FL=1
MQAYIPEFILAGLAMLLLLAETFCKKTPKFIFGLIGAAGTLAMLPFYMEGLYDNIYIILALVATAVTLLLSVDFRAVINLSSNDSKSQDGTGEFYILPLLACVGITSLCKASNLVELFVSLEVLTLSSFIMVGYFRRNLGSTEAGIKYLILGAVSTGFLVFGLAWYFGITGTFIYNETIVSHALAGQTAPAMYLALAMLLLGTAFKIGAVPMQLWIPDVYQGAPTPVTAFLSVASKVAGFALLGIILAPFAVLPPVEFVVALMAAATLLVGNLGAIPQTNLKRMMGYSSIAQAGFILPLFIGTVDGQLAPNAPFYLAVYLVMTFGAFFALAMIRIQRGSEEISAFRGLGKTNPRLALAVTIMFASLAGVPLTAGFFAKMISFVHVINTGLYLGWMLPVMIVCAASGFYYYFKVIRSMYWDRTRSGPGHFRSHAGRVFHLHRAGGPDAPVPEPHPVTNASFSPILPKAVSRIFRRTAFPIQAKPRVPRRQAESGKGKERVRLPGFPDLRFQPFQNLEQPACVRHFFYHIHAGKILKKVRPACEISPRPNVISLS